MSAEELRGLVAKATPGPLEVVLYGDGDSLVIHEKGTDNRLCFMATPGSAGDMRRIEANADLIVAAWSYLPALLSQLDDLKGRAERAESSAETVRDMLTDVRGDYEHIANLRVSDRRYIAALEKALERCAVIVERNLGRQNEKVADVPLVARFALRSSSVLKER